jgi:alkylated DNA repair protein alkB family protein 1
MPNEINELAKFIAYLFGYMNYRPEAGIVNYYHLNSTLSAHQDHSELNQDAPLISISFGNPAIFLIGSNTKTVKPISILIKSGDIVIMTGKSRLAYHAIPKILEDKSLSDYFAQNPMENTEFDVDESEWAAYYKYISINRINLNIRQVF